MARLAGGRERTAMRILVAGVAGLESQARPLRFQFGCSCAVTSVAFHLAVSTGEGEPRFPMIEVRDLLPIGRVVTLLAVLA